MRIRSLFAVAAFIAAMVLPGVAAAQSIAYAAPDGYSNLRSGPSTRYQVIARVYPGAEVEVLGCLETRAWCDVVVQGTRGWIFANRLEFVYGGRRVLVPDYYTYFGAPFVVFRFGDDGHSRRRSASDHSRWRSDNDHSRRRSANDHSRRRSDNDHSRRRSNSDSYKEGLHPPGGGDPGPEYVAPPESTDGSFLGHPGGDGPGPERIRPGREIRPPGEFGGGTCSPSDPGCVQDLQ